MPLATTGTLIELSGINLRDYSARALSLLIEPVDPGELAFDVNGGLHDLTMEQFRKYKFTISCTDVDAPDLDDVWKGQLVTITILSMMGFAEGTDGEQSFDCMLVSHTVGKPNEWEALTGWSLVLMQR